MKFLSLFAGIGGFDLGLDRAGMECAGQVEIDDYCNCVLEKHWPSVKRERDIRNVTGDTFSPVELVCGGTPCQPASVAGQQRGTKDDRWLWDEALRIVGETKPNWCIFENVTGILNLQGGIPFDNIVSEMERQGYRVLPLIIPASGVNARHRRDRVWIVAYSGLFGQAKHEKQTAGIKQSGENVGHSEKLQFNECRVKREKGGAQVPEFRNTGGTANVAYSEHNGRDGFQESGGVGTRNGASAGKSRAEQSSGSDCGEGGFEDMAHTCNKGLQGSKDTGNDGKNREKSGDKFSRGCDRGRSNEGELESRLGRVVDGISERMVRIGIEPDIPRVTTKSKNRAKRLKALGNAVVPLIPEIIGRCIMEVESDAI